MSAHIDSELDPLVADDELLLAIYELEVSTASRQHQPPRSHLCTSIEDVPRPSQRCPEGTNEVRTIQRSVRRAGPVRVYSRSPPNKR